MRYQVFGRRAGLRVSEFALGTANFGTGDPSIGPGLSREIFEAFVDAGGTTFDLSDIYQGGQAETMLGELLGARRNHFVLITKYSGTRDPSPPPGTTGNGRKNLIRSVDASLRRLRTDYLDVFMPHFPDGVTPTEEIVSGLDDLTQAGKILYGGLSNFPAWRVAGAATLADERGQAPLVGIAIAAETGTSPVQVALAWLRRRSTMSATALIPILGPRSLAHLRDYLASLELALDASQYERLAAAGAVRLGTPHEDVEAAIARGLDGDRTLVDGPRVPVV